jgi:porin
MFDTRAQCIAALIACQFLLSCVAHADPDEESPQREVDLRYITDLVGVIDGGVERDVAWMGRLDVAVRSGADFLGIPRAHAYLDLMLVHGRRFSQEMVGDAQVVSNVDAPSVLRPFEAWVEAPLNRTTRLKLGYIDLNSEFDLQPVGASFLNSSFGIAPDFSQSGQNGPSIFPVTSPGALLAVEHEGWTVRVAAFDAVPGYVDHPSRFLPGPPGRGGALLVAEGDVRIAGGELQLGGWAYTSAFPRLDGRGRGSSHGAYVQYEHRLVDNGKGPGLDAWVRVGRAAPAVNEIGTYIGGGLRWGTEDSHLGLGLAHARRGDPALRAEPGHRAETAIEATAFHRINDSFAIQPDLQYVRHPGWRGTPDALVLGVRLHFNTSFGLGDGPK